MLEMDVLWNTYSRLEFVADLYCELFRDPI